MKFTRAFGLVLAFALTMTAFATTAQAAPKLAPSVAGTAWQVTASWSDHSFLWLLGKNGRYMDSDGPTGTWTQDGASLTLKADAGFTYRVKLIGRAGRGTVYNNSDNSVAGTMTAKRLVAP